MSKKINTQVKEVLDESPVTTASRSRIDITETYHQCLAECYASKEWREYMENLINALTRDAVNNFQNIEDIRFKQGKIVSLKELLIRSKQAFELGNKINKIKSLEKNAS